MVIKMDDYTIYSEEEYYDRMQLLSIYSPTVCNCIWEEIIKYRKMFTYEIVFRNTRAYITLNKTLFHKMLRIYDLHLEDTTSKRTIISYLESESNGSEDLLIKYIHLNQLEISQTMFAFIRSNEFLLLRVYIIFEFIQDMDFLYLYLYLYKRPSWYPYISKIERSVSISNGQADLTKQFRNFLDSFYFHSTNNMIQLKGTAFKEMELDELIALYPTCNKKQLSFYLDHAQKNHYYTISQYMNNNQVSYETARKAMEHLVTLKFYKKIKVGKKYVFTPVD